MAKTFIGCAPSNFRKGRPAGMQPAGIVIHIMEGTLAGTDTWFKDPAAGVSAHYGVGRNGEVHQYVDEQDTAFHAGIVVSPTWVGIRDGINPNFYTIGIEHEGTAEEPWPWPDAQMNASAALIAEISSRWSFPPDMAHVTTHHSIRASKPCPGSKVQIAEILARMTVVVAAPLPAPSITEVVALKNANLRFQQPSTTARIVRIIPANAKIAAVGFTDAGERVQGNAFWYKDADGNFIWAGATDVPNPV